jgi:hypothetical protein
MAGTARSLPTVSFRRRNRPSSTPPSLQTDQLMPQQRPKIVSELRQGFQTVNSGIDQRGEKWNPRFVSLRHPDAPEMPENHLKKRKFRSDINAESVVNERCRSTGSDASETSFIFLYLSAYLAETEACHDSLKRQNIARMLYFVDDLPSQHMLATSLMDMAFDSLRM